MAKSNFVFKTSELTEQLVDYSEKGNPRGLSLGFKSALNWYSIKPGYSTFIAGAPHSGKTEFAFEILVQLYEYYNYKSVIFSSETGNKTQIAAEIISKISGKPFFQKINGALSLKQISDYSSILSQNIFIIDTQFDSISIDEFYKIVLEIEKENKIKINLTLGDPFNEFKRPESVEREDFKLGDTLKLINKAAFQNQWHNIICTHVRDQQPQKLKDGAFYFPPASPREWAGGQEWYRRAYGMILVYRPSVLQMNIKEVRPYEANETLIQIQKAKPKGIGLVGEFSIFWDWKKNRYYEFYDGGNHYAKNPKYFECQSEMFSPQPSDSVIVNDFNSIGKNEESDIPF